MRNGFPPPKYANNSVVFYDSDGYEIGSTDVYKNRLTKFLAKKTGKFGIHLVWYTINAAAQRVTEFDREIVDLISQDFLVCILLTKIDDCDEDSLSKFIDEVRKFIRIKKTHIFKVSTKRGEIQKYTNWDDLVEFTTEAFNTVVHQREAEQKVQKLAIKARVVIKDTHILAGASASIPIPLLDSVALIPILSRMVIKILEVYDLSLTGNVVKHIIKSTYKQILGKAAIQSGLLFLPLTGIVLHIAAGVSGNILIVNALGDATIDLCNGYLAEKLSNSKNKRNFEDIFTLGNFGYAVKKHLKNEGNAEIGKELEKS